MPEWVEIEQSLLICPPLNKPWIVIACCCQWPTIRDIANQYLTFSISNVTEINVKRLFGMKLGWGQLLSFDLDTVCQNKLSIIPISCSSTKSPFVIKMGNASSFFITTSVSIETTKRKCQLCVSSFKVNSKCWLLMTWDIYRLSHVRPLRLHWQCL